MNAKPTRRSTMLCHMTVESATPPEVRLAYDAGSIPILSFTAAADMLLSE